MLKIIDEEFKYMELECEICHRTLEKDEICVHVVFDPIPLEFDNEDYDPDLEVPHG